MEKDVNGEGGLLTRPTVDGAPALPRRAGKGLLPLSWVGRGVAVEYVGADRGERHVSGRLLDLHGFGPVIGANGGRLALSWDSITSVELEAG